MQIILKSKVERDFKLDMYFAMLGSLILFCPSWTCIESPVRTWTWEGGYMGSGLRTLKTPIRNLEIEI